MPVKITLLIPRKTPTRNNFLVGPRGQDWFKVKALKDAWIQEIPPASYTQRPTGHDQKTCHKLEKGKCPAFRRLHVERILGPKEREYDDDNISGGVKYIRDFLVKTGYLFRDDPRHCSATYSQAVRGAVSATVLTIEEPT